MKNPKQSRSSGYPKRSPAETASFLGTLLLVTVFGLPTLSSTSAAATPLSRPCATRGDTQENLEKALYCFSLYGDTLNRKKILKRLARASSDGLERARFHQAIAEADRGRYRKAISKLEKIARAHPEWLDVHIKLGELLQRVGKHRRARAVLDRIASLHDEGEIRRAKDLKWLGIALTLLNFPRDANDIFSESNRINSEDPELHIYWGHLLFQNHNPEEALESYEKALEIWPDHPDALIGKARVLFRAANKLPEANAILKKVLLLSPHNNKASLLLGQIALFLEDLAKAEEISKDILSRNPAHVETLALKAAVSFLRGDQESIEKLWRQAKKVSPQSPIFWHEIAKFGERFHRYQEIIPILEKALSLDPDYFPALVELGVAHSRQGDDMKARIFLQKARSADVFDQRAFYMTSELYDILNRHYTTREIDGVRFRAEKSEASVLIPVLSPWVRDAREFYSQLYDFKLEPPIQVEAFKKTETFAIRAVGTPRFWAHGVCFGHVLAMRSPNTGDFNIKEVLVHELAHAYHLQISKGRVPRWFTEGLAELDTMIFDPTLARETHAIMAQRLLSRRMEPLCTLSKSFVEAKTAEGLVEAYMQARWVLSWIHETKGRAAIQDMLHAFGNKKSTEEALNSGTQMDCERANEAFTQWISEKLSSFLPPHPFIPDKLPSVSLLKGSARKGDNRAGVLLAAKAFRKGDAESAQMLLDSIKTNIPPEKKLLQAEILAASGQFSAAEALCDELVNKGHGGFQVDLLKARIHTEQKLDKKSLESWKTVAHTHPRDPRPLLALEKAFVRMNQPGEAREISRKRADIDEHNGALRLSLLEDAVHRGALTEGMALVGKAMETAPLNPEVWLLRARIALQEKPPNCAHALAAIETVRKQKGLLDDTSLFAEVECLTKTKMTDAARERLMELSATHAGDSRLEMLKNDLDEAIKATHEVQ